MSEQEAPSVTAEPTVAPYYGIEGVERAMGYEPLDLEKEEEPPLTIESALELRQERQAEADSRTPETEVRTYSPLGELPDNVTLTIEQASAIRSEERQAAEKAAEEAQNEKLRAETDGKRLLAEADGIIAKVNAEPDVSDEIRPYLEAGLDRETAEAVSKPAVRQFLEESFAKADQTVRDYSAGLDTIRVHALATLAEVVPHLMDLQPHQFEQGLAVLSQADPAKFQTAMNILGRTNQIVQAQQAMQQHNNRQQAQVRYQEFEKQVKAEDARLLQMVGDEKTVAEANQAMLAYLDDRGVPRNYRLGILMNNPVLRTAEVRQTIWEAQKYREIQSAAKPNATRSIPPVQKPGTARPTGDGVNNSIQSLQRQLTNATGDRALKIGAQIQRLRRGR